MATVTATMMGTVAIDESGGLAVIGEGFGRVQLRIGIGIRFGIWVGVGRSARALAAFADLGWGGRTGGGGVGEVELDGFRRRLGGRALLWWRGGGARVV